jgi:FkbM family methyltransferase
MQFSKPSSILFRLRWFLERRSRARRYAIPYSRDKNWVAPQRLRIAGKWIDLSSPGDQGSSIALKDIFVSDVYWLDLLKSKQIHTVLDIGAHVGFFSLAAKHAFPGALVHAYEPNKDIWHHLESHANSAGFQAFNEAVGAKTGKVNTLQGQDSVFTKCVQSEHGTVSMVGISDAIRLMTDIAPLDLLKMDCEGGEWDILKSADALKRVRFLTMEYHLDRERTLSKIRQILSELGFVIEAEQEDGDNFGRILASNSHA